MNNPELKHLEKLNTSALKKLAKERGFSSKDAGLYGNALRRATWIKLLALNPEKPKRQKRETPAQSIISVNGCKPSKPKQKVVYGLKRLPIIKTIVYSYGGKKS